VKLAFNKTHTSGVTMGTFHLVTQVDTSIVLSLLFIECQEK